MSYIVFARKYRPQFFRDVVGQSHVTRTLLNGLLQKRVAHAYLFSGPRGIGKTTTARILARAINCAQPHEGEPCGVCERCKAVLEGRALDVIEIDAASNRSIEDIRQLREAIRYTPIEGLAKVYIIDEVHMLTTEAFNALLKTLEEPPPHAYFCLATTAPQKAPSTILSRCQRFDFRRVSPTEITDHLKHILNEERVPFDRSALELIARKADGSVRDALSLLDQVIAYSGGKVMMQDAIDVVGELRLDLYLRALALIDTHSMADAFILDADLAALGVDPQDYLVGLQQQIILLMQVRMMGVEKCEIPLEQRADYQLAADRTANADLARLLQLCSIAETDIRRNFNPRARLQLLLIRFALIEKSIALADLIARLENAQAGRQSAAQTTRSTAVRSPKPAAPNPSPAPKPSVAASAPVISPDNEDSVLKRAQDAWEAICERLVEQHNSSARMLQRGGFPVHYSNGVLSINFEGTTHLEIARSLGTLLRSELAAVIGDVNLNMQVGALDNSPNIINPEETPEVKMVIDRMGGRLV